MSRVIIIVNCGVNTSGKRNSASPVTSKMVTAIEKSILTHSPNTTVEVIAASALGSESKQVQSQHGNPIYCPLTIQLPDWFKFPSHDIYKACRDIEGRREWVERKLGYKTSIKDSCLGDLWLPVVLTKKGSCYGEVIGEGAIPNSYEQPIALGDESRQSLYHLADQLLKSLSAKPSVYLLQFRLLKGEIVFDRLWPFPAAPALASLGHQKLDLFAYHCQCLLGKSLLDMTSVPESFSVC
jgi:hypothetical protein